MERGFALKRYAYFLFRFVKTFADIVRFSYCRKKKKNTLTGLRNKTKNLRMILWYLVHTSTGISSYTYKIWSFERFG